MQDRLARLIEVFNRGSRELDALDRRRQALRDDLLRLAGGIQVLRDLCEQSGVNHPSQAGANGAAESLVAHAA